MSDVNQTSKREALVIRLDPRERRKLEQFAATWNVPLTVAVRRLILEKRVPKEE